MKRTRLSVLAVSISLAVGTTAAVALPLAAQGASGPNCAAFDDAVQYRINPKSSGGLMSPWASEMDRAAASHGFTENRGVIFQASIQADGTLQKVRRLHKANGDYIYSLNATEAAQAKTLGYVDEGASFSASAKAADCLVPVYRYLKGSRHQYAVDTASRAALVAAGWKLEGAAFYAGAPVTEARQIAPVPTPSPVAEPTPAVTKPAVAPVTPPVVEDKSDTKFTFAAMPDTQQEVLNTKDPRFSNRSKWLVANKEKLDLRFVTSSGDVVNWDDKGHSQYEMASAAMKPLEAAKIPYTLTIGNHDTQATDAPGGARDPKRTRILQRDTTTFNNYFTAERYGQVAGVFEAGKVDNLYTSYTAGGAKWMVLTLELWPRKSVVEWAKQVVASHPDHNVIITTHNYITGTGAISQGAGYGETSPQYLFDNLVSKYSNIKFVLCGHTGRAATSVSTGVHGNRIVNFNQTYHSNTTNPVRLIEVDTKAGTVTSHVHAPATGETYKIHASSHTGISYVK